MKSCKCGCGGEAKTPGGFVDRACAMRHNRVSGRVPKRQRPLGPAPKCPYCQVTPCKWDSGRLKWTTYCGLSCAMLAVRERQTPEQKRANVDRLNAQRRELWRRDLRAQAHAVCERAYPGETTFTLEQVVGLAEEFIKHGRVLGQEAAYQSDRRAYRKLLYRKGAA